MIKIMDLLNKLENVKQIGENFSAKCPAHNDDKNSLSITESNDGKILLHCFAGCEFSEIVKSLGYAQDDFKVNEKINKKIIASYDYKDEKNNLLYQVIRTDPKGFFQRRPNRKGGFINGLGKVRRVIYNLPEVINAINMKETIIFVEGEKDVENLKKIGLVATTSPMGAASWKADYAEFFNNSEVIIIPDADEPGEKYANTVAKSLKGKAASVRILKLPGLDNKGDVSDWIRQGGTKQELLNLIKYLPECGSEIVEPVENESERVILPCTDLGNAERLCSQYYSVIKYCCEAKTWLIWNEIRWEWDTTGQIERLAKKVVRNIYDEASYIEDKDKRISLAKWALESESKTRLRAMVELAKTEEGIPISRSNLDKNDWFLNCLNGTIELKTGKLREHRREDYITLIAPVNYDPNAKSEILEKFIDRILPDEELKEFVQIAAGYGISGDTSEEKLFFAYGPAATGKSTLFAAIKATLGDYASQTDFTTFLDQGNSGAVRNDVARLAGKRFVLTSEVDEGKKMAESLVKQITGNDTITARFLYQEAFEFVPKMKIFMAANFRPRVNANDNAMWRRICQIPFTVHIPKEERDPSIKKFLSNPVNGGPAILSWLVDGCLKWQRDGLIVPKIVEDFTNEYKEEMDPIRDFLDDCCVKGKYAHVNNTKLYQEYEDWAKENGEKYIMSRKRFSQNLELKGFIQKRTSHERIWTGIGLKANDLDYNSVPDIRPKVIELNIEKDVH